MPQVFHFLNSMNISIPYGYWTFAVICVLLFLQLHHMVRIYFLRKPNTFIWTRGFGFFGQWYTSLYDHLTSSEHIKSAYLEARGKPFTIPGIGKYKTFITNWDQLAELERAPVDQLSFNPIVEQQLATDIIFHGFKFDPKDPRHAIPIHSLRVLYKKNVNAVIPVFKNEVQHAFAKDLQTTGHGNSEWIRKHPFMISQRIFERLTNVLMVGKELADDPVFLKNVSRFILNSRFAQEILRWTPSLIGPLLGRLIMAWDGSKTLVYGRVMDVLLKRMTEKDEFAEKPLDMLQWMLDSTRQKTPAMIQRLAQHSLLFYFAGANAPPMLLSFALMKLCQYPEYLEPLREEIERLDNEPETEEKYNSMVYMDSFLKETARLQPLLAFTLARQVLKPFTFADGTHVPKDNWICAPQQMMHLEEANYSSPYSFDPFRFVPAPGASQVEVENAQFTTSSYSFLFWSAPKRACTGRFFVSVTSKMILAEFIKLYDFKLENPRLPEQFGWNHILLPHPLAKILFRRRATV